MRIQYHPIYFFFIFFYFDEPGARRPEFLLMGGNGDVYRVKAAHWEERAKNERHKTARDWQLTVARVYQILATEAQIMTPEPRVARLHIFVTGSTKLADPAAGLLS